MIKQKRCNCKRGFTLIELLVVIAIIALLLSIVVPAFNKAKMSAEEIVCKNNLRQYGIATEMYLSDNKDHFPDPWFSMYDTAPGIALSFSDEDQHIAGYADTITKSLSFPGEAQRYCRWHNPEYNLESHPEYAGPYWPYLQVTKANMCPTFAKIAPKYAEDHMEGNGGASASDCIGGPFVPQFSYSMNSVFYQEDDSGNFIPVKRSQVASPSQTFTWAEENMWTLPGLSNYVLNDNALCVSDDSTVDNLGSFHKISTSQLATQQGERKYQNGVSNVLMLDGSLSVLPPTESLTYVGKIK